MKLESVVFLMTFQALSRDLLRVSVQLESVEEQLQSTTNARWTVTMEELEKERDMLKKRRETLDAQLKENRVLSVEVRQKETMCTVFVLCCLQRDTLT